MRRIPRVMSRVPTIATVVRGAGVNIVLKADQPTGRTVAGTVQDVLTRGNHPRGIKVRLTDGRVGRVQSHSGSQQAGLPTEQEMLEAAGGPVPFEDRRPPRRREGRRQEPQGELPPSQVGLEAYIRPAKQKNGGRNRAAAAAGTNSEVAASNATVEVVTCPVCGVFEGDAAAVEHHVASHFD
ncbi:MFS multidrug transporter [Colletotrichum truncatum]|uniref:MFS multidrug transporter n=1 Tax=Colletotrichum truncatum TaxID=5467 RepID=A0ACC3YNB1_COLTU|nr:MFS multidrug transporter [Colletotrichum truncatum]KAF6789515.1 MFS multidrug transporter [Colletotrichum truncatum]